MNHLHLAKVTAKVLSETPAYDDLRNLEQIERAKLHALIAIGENLENINLTIQRGNTLR